jgi:serine phosphatase RsbU (regulator of sigma subunit)
MDKIESKAFQRAALDSESFRVLRLLCLLGALVLYAIASGLAAGEFRLLLAQTMVLALAFVYEAFMLAVVKRALREERDVPPVMWMPDIFIETQLPTVALFLLMKSPSMDPYNVLVTPAVLLYFLFIILSTLRLSPALSFLTGLMSALGYLGAALYVHQQHPNTAASLYMSPLVYFVYAGLILAGGIVSAIVAERIRIHVSAAIREADLERELDRVKHDLDIARSIQQGLLPAHSPRLDDFEVAGWNQPADQAGGDYFDWLELPDGRLAISLGDASGHGIGPALVTASCRAYARASFLADGKQDGLLDRLNRLLAEDLSANRFVTFAVVFLDPARSRLQVLSAGHGPIMLYRYATGKIEKLEAQGIPLGMLAGVKYGVATKVSLSAGDMLVLVTDGFYEWEDPEGEQFGLKRIEAVIRNSRDHTAEEVIARLRSAVVGFCRGTRQQDDLTAVIVRRKAKAIAAETADSVRVRILNQAAAQALQATSAPRTGA